MKINMVRGKVKGEKDFIYGNLLTDTVNGKMCIYSKGIIREIDPKTQGRFTGMISNNGKPIFVGDIVENAATIGIVMFEDGMFTLNTSAKTTFGRYRQPLSYNDCDEFEIVGNVVDNYDLAMKLANTTIGMQRLA